LVGGVLHSSLLLLYYALPLGHSVRWLLGSLRLLRVLHVYGLIVVVLLQALLNMMLAAGLEKQLLDLRVGHRGGLFMATGLIGGRRTSICLINREIVWDVV
jgi:hypothetical protein